MRLRDRLTEAYRRPLADLTQLSYQPIRDGAVRCPGTGQRMSEAECRRCPAYVRTHVFDLTGGQWLQPTIACVPPASPPVDASSATTAH